VTSSWSPVAALPVPYRTDPDHPNFQGLVDTAHPPPSGRPFPTALDPFTCTRYEIADFTRAAVDAGVRYLGLCCGAAPHHVRAMAEALGRAPGASRYTEDMSKHVYFGSDPSLARHLALHPVVDGLDVLGVLRRPGHGRRRCHRGRLGGVALLTADRSPGEQQGGEPGPRRFTAR